VNDVCKLTGTTYPTANQLVERLTKAGILVEFPGRARNRRFIYDPYVKLFGKPRRMAELQLFELVASPIPTHPGARTAQAAMRKWEGVGAGELPPTRLDQHASHAILLPPALPRDRFSLITIETSTRLSL
jgi:hypothetical protein